MIIKPTSNFIKAGVNVQNGDIVKLLDEGTYVDMVDKTTSKKKKVLQFEVELIDGDKKTYTMNNTTQVNLTQEFGNDSKEWVGKLLRAFIVNQMAFGKLTKVLILAPESWEEPVREVKAQTIKTEEAMEANDEE
jgi:hypothetical protein